MRHGWLSEREQRAWRSLQFMQMRLEGELARRLTADSGLSYPDYVVLVALTERPDGTARLFKLAADLGWEKSRLSHHVTRMADRGLVTKRPSPVDRRGAVVVVTAAGRRAIEAAAPGHVDDVRRLFVDHVTPDELDVIAAVAERVLAALDAETSPPA